MTETDEKPQERPHETASSDQTSDEMAESLRAQEDATPKDAAPNDAAQPAPDKPASTESGTEARVETVNEGETLERVPAKAAASTVESEGSGARVDDAETSDEGASAGSPDSPDSPDSPANGPDRPDDISTTKAEENEPDTGDVRFGDPADAAHKGDTGDTDSSTEPAESGLDLSRSRLDPDSGAGQPPKGPTNLTSPAPPGDPPGSRGEELERMTLIGHLEELRDRIVRSLIVGFVGFLITFYFSKEIYRFLARPVMAVLPEGKKLVFLTVTEPFFLYMKVAALAALFLTSPYILWQIWRFIAPGLYRHERSYSLPFIFFGSTFFLAGGVFAYYVAFPFAIEFLIGVGIDDFEAAITGTSYFSFLLTVILGLGVMFELPVFIFVLSQLGLVTPRFLMKNFRWAVLLIFIAAAIITPTPDIINLTLFAVPTIILYLVGVAAAWLVGRNKQGKKDEISKQTD